MSALRKEVVRKVKTEDCPIGLDKVHCQNCYFWRDGKCDYDAVIREYSKKREGLFRVSGNNGGLACPFEPIVCRRGYCDDCETYHDWQELGEILVICAWCNKVKDRKPNLGRPVVSGGICPECVQKHFPALTAQIR